MTSWGLLSGPLMHAQDDYRHNPPVPLIVLVAGSLRRGGRALLEVAEAMLRPPESDGAR
jgi:hypothetical protein